jgi:hypothetical protein
LGLVAAEASATCVRQALASSISRTTSVGQWRGGSAAAVVTSRFAFPAAAVGFASARASPLGWADRATRFESSFAVLFAKAATLTSFGELLLGDFQDSDATASATA